MNTPYCITYLAVFLLVSQVGCDGGDGAGPGTDVAVDTVDPVDLVAPRDRTASLDLVVPPSDAEPELPPVDPCVELPFDGIVPVDLYGPDTQIHGAAAFDGGGIWVTYNRGDADGGSGFDVFATRIGCDGAVLVEPFLVNEAVSHNETDPTVAVSGDTVMFAWQSDNGQQPTNLSIWYRSYDIDGTPRMETDRILELDPAGAGVDPNIWMPALTGTADGFALAGAHAPEGYNVFQIWLQLLDADGDPLAEGIHLSPDPDHSQVWPALGRGAGDALIIAWERQHIELPATVEYVLHDSDGLSAVQQPGDAGTTPALSDASEGSGAWIAMSYAPGAEHNIALAPLGTDGAAGALHVLENGGGLDHTPILAAGTESRALVWYRNLGGLKNDLLFRAFVGLEGSPSWLDEPVVVNPVPVAPYPAAMVSLPGGFFVVWSDGDNPDYRAKGRFLRQPEARR